MSELMRRRLRTMVLGTMLWACFSLGLGAQNTTETVRVIVDKATIWRNPTGTAGVVAIVSTNTRLQVKGHQGRWLVIEDPIDPRRTAFILESQTEPANGRTSPASAPSRAPRTGQRVQVFTIVNGGLSTNSTRLVTSQTAFTAAYQETGTITATYAKPPRAQFHAAFGFGRGAFAVGGGVMVDRSSQPSDVSASVPSPFLFNAPRTATATSASLNATNLEFQIPVFWSTSWGRRGSLVAFGGPSIFWTARDTVNNVVLNEAYPFSTVSIASTTSARHSGHGFGGHIGVEAFYGRRPAIGGGVSFSRGTVSLNDSSGLSGSVHAGGVRGLFGIRWPF